MRSASQEREHAQAVDHVREFMRRHRLSLDDLVEIGGQDFHSPDSKRVEKARRVERCWALMAQLGVKHTDLSHDWAPTAVPMPGMRRRRRRGEGAILQATEIAGVSATRLEANSSMKSMPPDFGGPQLNLGDMDDAVAAGGER
jgi:hypothetical protein